MTSAGLRLGNGPAENRFVGLTVKQRIQKKITLEAIAQTNLGNTNTLHLLVEQHHNLVGRRLNAFAGAGISTGNEEGQFTTGVDLIAGVELTLLKVHLSLDYKPNVNLVGRDQWYTGQVGISARTVLITNRKANKKRRKRKRRRRQRERQEKKEAGQLWWQKIIPQKKTDS
ncbi:MAG: hypothetical protein AAGI38_11785 [Bacteroidota bacterium]